VFALGASLVRAETFSLEAVKAAFLYRFASYVEWPADSPSSPFVIAVAGDEDVAKQLEELVPRMVVNHQPVQLRRAARVADLDGVHILYVGPEALARTRALRTAALERPILMVTDDDHGLDAGAVINFVEAKRNVRFEISLIAADRARLKIDSALLSVAAHVERRPAAIRSVDEGTPK
jgi:hypothetical protein